MMSAKQITQPSGVIKQGYGWTYNPSGPYVGNDKNIVGLTTSKALNLKTNTSYTLSCVVWGETADFLRIDLYSDTLPETLINFTTTPTRYTWTLSSSAEDMAKCRVRFFKEGGYTASVTVVDVKLEEGTVATAWEPAIYINKNGEVKTVNSIYAGVLTEVPVYEEQEVAWSYENLTKFFSMTNTGGGWNYVTDSDYGVRFYPSNIGQISKDAQIILTALEDINSIQYTYEYVTESSYDKVTLISNTTKILNAVSGTLSKTTNSTKYSLKKGEKITLLYHTDSSNNVSGEKVNIWFTISNPIVGMVQNGSEQKLVVRKVLKGYVGVGGIAKCFYNQIKIDYTGDYTISKIQKENKIYNLYTITSSGILTLNSNVDVWMCGGGAEGTDGWVSDTYSTYVAIPGGGGGGHVLENKLLAGSYTVSIGSAGFSTIIQNEDNTTLLKTLPGSDHGVLYPSSYTNIELCKKYSKGGNGGSGGGAGGWTVEKAIANPYVEEAGKGDGISTYPFGIISLGAHCAGGGGGCNTITNYQLQGGNGGTNGSDGGASIRTMVQDVSIPYGGTRGGGRGGYSSVYKDGGSATFYGSGGGGAYCNYNGSKGKGGSGYQGVVYLLVP